MADKEPEVNDQDLLKQITEREKSVFSLIQKKDIEGALKASLADPPVNAKSVDVKRKAAGVVAQVLTSSNIKDSDIDTVVGKLDDAQLDLLMKYIYRCLETGEINSVPLFKWHKAVRDKASIGCIVRALSDRKSV